MPDLRKYRRQTNSRLILGALFLLFFVGDGLIYILYGGRAAIMGMLCIGLGIVPIIIIVLFLWVIEAIVKRSNPS